MKMFFKERKVAQPGMQTPAVTTHRPATGQPIQSPPDKVAQPCDDTPIKPLPQQLGKIQAGVYDFQDVELLGNDGGSPYFGLGELPAFRLYVPAHMFHRKIYIALYPNTFGSAQLTSVDASLLLWRNEQKVGELPCGVSGAANESYGTGQGPQTRSVFRNALFPILMALVPYWQNTFNVDFTPATGDSLIYCPRIPISYPQSWSVNPSIAAVGGDVLYAKYIHCEIDKITCKIKGATNGITDIRAYMACESYANKQC
jgi:hypothetical protein